METGNSIGWRMPISVLQISILQTLTMHLGKRCLFLECGNSGILPLNIDKADFDGLDPGNEPKSWTPEWLELIRRGLYTKRDLQGGQMSRDMTIYVDDDGKAYHIYSSEENLTLQIAELTDDYTAHSGRYVRVAPAGHNEAPAIFKHKGTYWMITSGCTGWDPNEARMFSAENIMGRHSNLTISLR